MSTDARAEDRAYLAGELPKSAHRYIDAILAYFVPEQVDAVEVRGARVVVEEIDAHGLVIGLDAHGNAATVGFPYGADITEAGA